ncbi:DeoR/GlpR family DNA-binding transcription regulator [Agathobaculum sp. NTUH-O15-33]|uniref:DeoR/GlpR family DNA-binding transcription regulator n=1 Tax=Agathobaculum sp. NTUH-O15-33 TaxID=3079302 RepID=UPI0029588EDB|nr:DeoR/GlpR family DNA-binding transcription regulator [Agathobaculum sp. NTUH-O15-33]WNX83899.1 DeoR/GlpR family DNA-binding transcription regulator [Agathobaculum sp. NTUH-O15-33]
MATEREGYILQKIQEEKRVKVAELAEALDVTPETIRKDLTELEERRLLQRVHGGAVALSYFKSSEPAYADRSQVQIEAKQRIAAEVAKEILPGETLLIDNGSTVYELAKLLRDIPQLTVITPSIKIAMEFLKNPSSKVLLLGGWLRTTEPSTVGDVTLNQLKGLHVNKTILSVAGLSAEHGLTEYLEEDAAIKRQALACGEKNIVLADHTKLDVTALLTVAPIDEIDEVYVDGEPDDPKLFAIRDKGVHVVCVPAAEQQKK